MHLTAFCILLCAYLNCLGWVLSATHSLNRWGYAVGLLLFGVAVWWGRQNLGLTPMRGWGWFRIRSRFKRLFPAAFLTVAGLALLGGILHAPTNYDALAYRVPRVLHWLAAEQWHWVHTDFNRLNTRAAGYEWVSAPILLFTQSVRPLFLISFVSFGLLPGLVFSVFTRLGVARRVAWYWMWLAPTGYCFVLQAGGIGNDVFGATFALAAFDFALRARQTRKWRESALAVLAMGLLTSGKTSNLPLLLPLGVVLVPVWRTYWSRPLATLAVIFLALGASFLPTALLNLRHCGDWTGAKAEGQWLIKGDPRVTIPGNVLLLTLQNYVPPVFPLAKQWNAAAAKQLPAGFHQAMKENFESNGADLYLPEMQNEEAAGFGLGLSLLLLLSLLAGTLAPARSAPAPGNSWLRWLPWPAALVYLAKATVGTTARIFAPYYLLLMPALLGGRGQAHLCRSRWWRAGGLLVFLIAALLLVVTPSRPLWPAQTILTRLNATYPHHPLLQRALTVYSVYGIRAEGLEPIRILLPPGERAIGLVTFDDLETSLWPPFGSRRFHHVLAGDTRADLDRLGIRHVIINTEWVPSRTEVSLEQWLAKYQAEIVHTRTLRLRAGRGEFDWHVVRLK